MSLSSYCSCFTNIEKEKKNDRRGDYLGNIKGMLNWKEDHTIKQRY